MILITQKFSFLLTPIYLYVLNIVLLYLLPAYYPAVPSLTDLICWKLANLLKMK